MTTVNGGVVVTHFAGRAGDHNNRAISASPRLAAALAERFQVSPTTIAAPQPALSSNWEAELAAARDDLTQMRRHYHDLFARGATPVTALSRCAVALATLPVLAQHRPDTVVVWFDAHADLNTPDNTTTGYLGGLALSGPLGLWESGLGAGLAAENTILVGARDIDPPESALIERSELTLLPPGPNLALRLGKAVAGRPVYVHIDCDVLNPGLVPTDYRVPGGISLPDLRCAAIALASSEVVGIEIGELETITGTENLGPLIGALGPIFEALR